MWSFGEPSAPLFFEENAMIDDRSGETKKKQPSQDSYFPKSENPPLPSGNVQPSQKKAPKQPYCN